MNKKIAGWLQSLAVLACGLAAAPAGAEGPAWKPMDQGPNWTDAARKDFYSRDQGSRLMPLRWISALRQADGQPFMADSLSRYGYLPNEWSSPPGLPVGFTVDNGPGGGTLGITCSACHTRQIEVGGAAYRVDGGPAVADFQSFLADLDAAVGKVLGDEAAFAEFAQAVLGPYAPPGRAAALKEAVQAWYTPFHTLNERALPKDKPWGPTRLDAVSMIFDRLAGLDIGAGPDRMIPENIQPADAPVRYPFLWNAPIQDKTQWPGFADNGDSLLALARNLGEVYGVFGVFHPKKSEQRLLGIDYLDENSANFQGLDALEDLLWRIGPPKWPWPVDAALVNAGKAIYDRPTDQGGCADCHRVKPGKPRLLNKVTWDTPVQDVGTDSREYAVLTRAVKTGVMEGAQIPLLTQPLKPVDAAASVLGTAVRGAILQRFVPVGLSLALREKLAQDPEFAKKIEALKGAYPVPSAAPPQGPPPIAYESRVLEGIWATAPYLHNGSVRSLADLLEPAEKRAPEFKVGPAYDPASVGLAAEQAKFNFTLKTTGCEDRGSGNSRCGHEFGTWLSPEEKKALLEYLKIL